VDAIISEFVFFGFTGSVCLKSPPNNMDKPPNRESFLPRISLRDLSTHSKHLQSLIVASSHMTMEVWLSNSERSVLFFIVHMEVSER